MEPAFERIGIVGLGLIGGSIALGVRAAWPHVAITGVDRPDVIEAARRKKLIDADCSEIAGLTGVDLIVLAAPVPQIVELVKAAARARLTAVITDVGSTKRQIMQAAAAAGLASFVGGHPIAGAERGGLDHARPNLFDGRPWLLVAEGAAGDSVARVERLARGLGAVPRQTDAHTHDRTMAYVSHLPQMIAVALMNGAADAVGADGLAASGRAFAEMTRLASSPPDLWQGILESNADFVDEAVAALAAALTRDGGRSALGEFARVKEEFERARRWRDRLSSPTPDDHD